MTVEVIADRFEIEEHAASGGMGVVYRARDRRSGESVALKLLRDTSPVAAERFTREAEIIAKLDHPRVVRYLAHGPLPDGHYLAMEWLDGETLAARVGRGRLDVADSLTLIGGVCEALAVVHRAGHVHRDIKPSNLFLPGGDVARVKVLDFGVARLHGGERLTRAGSIIGTPGFMAPEQVQGEDIDARTDIFALGCVLFECLTGEPAFAAANDLELLAKIIVEEVAPPSELRTDLPPGLDALVARMLAKDKAQRPADAAELLEDLRAVLDGTAPAAPALTSGEGRVLSVILIAGAAILDLVHEATRPADSEHGSRETLHEVAAVYGALVTELVGGSLIITLGGAAVATDQATRAARCALALGELLGDAAIALVTGHGALTHGGRNKRTGGDLVQRAAALLAGNTRAGVRLDETTAGLLDGRFEVVRDESIWLCAERPYPDAPRTVLGRATPFVGREQELASLVGQFQGCVEHRSAGAALVVGPAGVGKSRLLQELRATLAAQPAPPRIWIASGESTRVGSPFGMLAPMIRRLAGLADGEPLAVRRAKLHARLAEHLAGEALERARELIGELVGFPASDEASLQLRAARHDPALRAEQMRRAWTDWIDAESAAAPLVIMLEDLHWGDLPSLQLVESALELVDRPILVVAAARPDVSEIFPALFRDQGLHAVRLGPLRPRACERLARAVLGTGPSAASVDRLIDRAGGNAFCLEELLRAFAEGKADELPPSVVAIVAARLERLEPEARRVLRAASVFGQVFRPGGVAALVGSREGAVAGWLATLVDRELVCRRAARGDELAFRHALVRDGAYALLGDAERQLGHRLAARWLETAGEDDAHIIAEHHDRGGDPASAVTWYVRAADQATRANDFAAVLARVNRGLELGAVGEVRGQLLLGVVEAKDWAGDFDGLDAVAPEAMALLPADSPGWYRAAWKISGNDMRRLRLEPLRTLAAELRRRHAADPVVARDPAFIECAVRAAFMLQITSQSDLAESLLVLVESSGEEVLADRPLVHAALLEARGARAVFAGDPQQAFELISEAAALTERAGALSASASHLTNASSSCLEGGRFAEAETVARRALILARRLKLSSIVASAQHHLSYALAGRGAFAEACAESEQAVAVYIAQGDARMESVARTYLARIHLLAGHLEVAESEARRAVAGLDSAPTACATALGVLTQALVGRGAFAEAVEVGERGLAIANRLGGLEELEGPLRLGHAEALHAFGDPRARTAILAARDRLKARAGRMTDPDWRADFLAAPDHARTFALAEAWDDSAESTVRDH